MKHLHKDYMRISGYLQDRGWMKNHDVPRKADDVSFLSIVHARGNTVFIADGNWLSLQAPSRFNRVCVNLDRQLSLWGGEPMQGFHVGIFPCASRFSVVAGTGSLRKYVSGGVDCIESLLSMEWEPMPEMPCRNQEWRSLSEECKQRLIRSIF